MKRLIIFDNKIIKALIINTKVETTIWLLIKKNKYFYKRFKRSDKTINKVNFNINL